LAQSGQVGEHRDHEWWHHLPQSDSRETPRVYLSPVVLPTPQNSLQVKLGLRREHWLRVRHDPSAKVGLVISGLGDLGQVIPLCASVPSATREAVTVLTPPFLVGSKWSSTYKVIDRMLGLELGYWCQSHHQPL
jgi:hypothetical protein